MRPKKGILEKDLQEWSGKINDEEMHLKEQLTSLGVSDLDSAIIMLKTTKEKIAKLSSNSTMIYDFVGRIRSMKVSFQNLFHLIKHSTQFTKDIDPLFVNRKEFLDIQHKIYLK